MAGDDDDAAERRMDALMTTLLHSQRSKGAFRKRFGVFDLFSVLLFSAMTIAAIASFSEVYWLFAAILAIDCAATVFDVGQAVAATRSVFFLAAIIASIVTVPYDIPFLVFEVLLLVFLLDVSFFLRKLESTRVDRSVFKAKSMSYFWVFVPALLLSYVPVYLLLSCTPAGLSRSPGSPGWIFDRGFHRALRHRAVSFVLLRQERGAISVVGGRLDRLHRCPPPSSRLSPAFSSPYGQKTPMDAPKRTRSPPGTLSGEGAPLRV